MLLDDATHTLRVRLIQEEFDELKEALVRPDLVFMVKELADPLYVVYRTAVA